MSKKTFEVCVFISVEAPSLEAAEGKIKYSDNISFASKMSFPPHETDNSGQRVYYAHPEKYSVEEWEDRCERGLDDSEDEDE